MKISIRHQSIARIIPLAEVKATPHYDDMADLAVIFNHKIIEDDDGVWRWQKNQLINWIYDHAPVYTPSGAEARAVGNLIPHTTGARYRAGLDLNTLFMDLHDEQFRMEEWMKFYMQLGYSLSGFAEVFGQREADEFKLPDTRPEEDIINYMLRKHKDQVLKL